MFSSLVRFTPFSNVDLDYFRSMTDWADQSLKLRFCWFWWLTQLTADATATFWIFPNFFASQFLENFSKMNPSRLAVSCFLNILLAIFACVLITHASLLKSADQLCLKPLTSEVKCSGILPSCKLEYSTKMAEYGLYVYAISMGIASVLMLIQSCCSKAR